MVPKHPPKRTIASVAKAASKQSAASWHRDQRTQRFGHPTYGDYLTSSDWYRLKARYRRSDLPQDCQLCGAGDEIDFHHRTYERICEEELTDLIPLCGPCHRLAHALVRRGDLPDFDIGSLRSLVDAKRARKGGPSQTEIDQVSDCQRERNRLRGAILQQESRLVEVRERRMAGATKQVEARLRKLRNKLSEFPPLSLDRSQHRGEAVSRRAHIPEIAGSNPAGAMAAPVLDTWA